MPDVNKRFKRTRVKLSGLHFTLPRFLRPCGSTGRVEEAPAKHARAPNRHRVIEQRGPVLAQRGIYFEGDTVNTFLWVLVTLSALLIIKAAPSGYRVNGPTWFDLLPYMKPSKKQSGRAQQQPRKRKR